MLGPEGFVENQTKQSLMLGQPDHNLEETRQTVMLWGEDEASKVGPGVGNMIQEC